MAVNPKPLRITNQQQIRVKTFKTYALLLLDKYPATFNIVLNDGKRSGFYIRTADNTYKVGSLQVQSNTVPLSSEGLSPEEAEQVILAWKDITDRPVATPQQIDELVLHTASSESGYSKVILEDTGTKDEPIELQAGCWYIASINLQGDYELMLPANPKNLDTVKVSVQNYKVANVRPWHSDTANADVIPIVISNDSREFIYDSDKGDWIVVK